MQESWSMICINSILPLRLGRSSAKLRLVQGHRQDHFSVSRPWEIHCLLLGGWKIQVCSNLPLTVPLTHDPFATGLNNFDSPISGSCAQLRFNTRYKQDLFQFDASQGKWTALSPFAGLPPSIRCGLGLAATKGRLFMFGGFDIMGLSSFSN
jgi:hypothetical protein